MLKRAANIVFQKAPFAGLMNLLEGLNTKRANLLRVLTYHLIEDAGAFKQQIDFLAKTYYIAGMSEVIDACKGKHNLPPDSVMITFDDAYQNFAVWAWPILKQYNFPVTLFVPTAYPGNPARVYWWDKLENAFAYTSCRDSIVTPIGRLLMTTGAQRGRAYKRLRSYVKTLPNLETMAFVDELCKQIDAPLLIPRVLNWDELRQLAGEGLTIGAHTQTHPILNRISIQEARDEAAGSLRDLQREIGPIEPIFAYPSGYYTREVVQVIKDLGFFLAFTTKPGTNDLNDPDLLLMRRNNIGRKSDQSTMRARLLQASLFWN